MINKISVWIEACRPHTLPLAFANVLLASLLAFSDRSFNIYVFIFSLLTTLLLQILSNFSNDFGDAVKNTDNMERLGPQRTVQSGKISQNSMKAAIVIISLLTFFSGTLLIYVGTKGLDYSFVIIFYALGVFAILASIKYTIGKNPYGYQGLGDFFVFVFFGLVGVLGTYFLHTHTIPYILLFPAIAIGSLSVGVININNLRDIENDEKSGKRTIAVSLGKKNTQLYHTTLIAIAIICAFIFALINNSSIFNYLFVLCIPFLMKNIIIVYTYNDPKELIPALKQLSVTTLIFSLTFGLGMII